MCRDQLDSLEFPILTALKGGGDKEGADDVSFASEDWAKAMLPFDAKSVDRLGAACRAY